jgi:hypothetical protein
MVEMEGVTEFVNGFFEQSLAEQGVVEVEAVELLAQTVERNDGAGASQLRFAENVFQDWDVKIDRGDADDPPEFRAHQGLHALQQFRRVILLALNVVRRGGVELDGENLGPHSETPCNASAQVLKQGGLQFSDRQQVHHIHFEPDSLKPIEFNQVHRDSTGVRVQP